MTITLTHFWSFFIFYFYFLFLAFGLILLTISLVDKKTKYICQITSQVCEKKKERTSVEKHQRIKFVDLERSSFGLQCPIWD